MVVELTGAAQAYDVGFLPRWPYPDREGDASCDRRDEAEKSECARVCR